VVVDLVVRRNIDPADFAGAEPSPGERSDMDADIAVLLRRERVMGLEVWRMDGSLIYADRDHPGHETRMPADELRKAQSGAPWVETSSSTARGTRTLDVFLPYRGGLGQRLGTVEVLIP
jgi:hypothetical protein